MGPDEYLREKLQQFTSLGILGAGVGYGLVQTLADKGPAIQGIAARAQGQLVTPNLRTKAHSPIKFQEELLQEAFSSADDVMSSVGLNETLRRTYTRALYRSGMLSEDKRNSLIQSVMDAGSDWGTVRGQLLKHSNEFGGMENVYESLREVLGGTVSGSKNLSVAELMRGFASEQRASVGLAGGLNDTSFFPGYTRSQFDPQGRFWSDLYPTQATLLSDQTAPLSNQAIRMARRFETKSGFPTAAGMRTAESSHGFISFMRKGTQHLPGMTTPTELPYVEFRVNSQQGKHFISVPTVPDALVQKGMNVVGNKNGMGFSFAPSFTVPVPGGGRKIVGWKRISFRTT